jgi:hypothetical protein
LVAPRLSHKSSGGWGRENFISVKSDRIHIDSEAAVASAWYSASVDDHAIARCFLELHERRFEPSIMR